MTEDTNRPDVLADDQALYELLAEGDDWVVVRDSWRPWIVTSNDQGDLWAHSWHNEDEDAPHRMIEDLAYPVTVLAREAGSKTVLAEVLAERARQDEKWGEQNHPDVDQVLMTRAGGCSPQRMAEHYEIPTATRAKFITDTAAARGQSTFAAILIEEVAEAVEAATLNDGTLRTELIQVAAVATQWVEAIDRRAAPRTCGRCYGCGRIINDDVRVALVRPIPCPECAVSLPEGGEQRA